MPHNHRLIQAQRIHEQLRMPQRKLHRFQILGRDPIHPRAVIANGPLGFHEGVQQYLLWIFGIDDGQSTQGLVVLRSGDGIFGLAHFAIDGDGGGVGGAPWSVGAGCDPVVRGGKAGGEFGLLDAGEVEGVFVV